MKRAGRARWPTIRLGALERRMYEEHTREESGRAFLVVGVQGFGIESSANQEDQPERADWYRRMLARALGRLLREEAGLL